MLLTLGINSFRFLFFVFTFSFLLFSLSVANAEESLTLSVTPPLFQLTVAPGEFWASSLKVVNTNSYDLNFYATVMNFDAEGEAGHGKFTPLINEGFNNSGEVGHSLADWIEVSGEPILVLAGDSKEILFSVSVPDNAEPGGHYAAILVGTKPSSKIGTGPVVSVSSFVSSLLFLRVPGEIVEKGNVRQFTTAKTLYKKPEANFMLRFENTGNVHLKPQGDIIIYNMWGKKRGEVLINQNGSNFGNVLPHSIRRFEFSWVGEGNIFEIGRYTAVATLSFGQDSRKNVSAETHFWVVPIVPVGSVLGSFLFFILVIVWFIKRYIRRALILQKEFLESLEPKETIKTTFETFTHPFKEGVVDLRNIGRGKTPIGHEDVVSDTREAEMNSLTSSQFLKKYKLFFLFLLVVSLVIIGCWIYFGEVLVSDRSFNVEVKNLK